MYRDLNWKIAEFMGNEGFHTCNISGSRVLISYTEDLNELVKVIEKLNVTIFGFVRNGINTWQFCYEKDGNEKLSEEYTTPALAVAHSLGELIDAHKSKTDTKS